MANDLYTNFVDSFRTQCQEPAFGGDNSRMSTRSGMGADGVPEKLVRTIQNRMQYFVCFAGEFICPPGIIQAFAL